jgi:hypothetical protein
MEIPEPVRELRPHAVFWLLEKAAGGLVIAALVAVVEYFKHHLDLASVIASLVFSIGVLVWIDRAKRPPITLRSSFLDTPSQTRPTTFSITYPEAGQFVERKEAVCGIGPIETRTIEVWIKGKDGKYYWKQGEAKPIGNNSWMLGCTFGGAEAGGQFHVFAVLGKSDIPWKSERLPDGPKAGPVLVHRQDANRTPTTLPPQQFISVCVHALSLEPSPISRGKRLKIIYLIDSSDDVADNIWLGASFEQVHSVPQDVSICLVKGRHEYERYLTIPETTPPGHYKLNADVWLGVRGDSTKSKRIARGGPVDIEVVA